MASKVNIQEVARIAGVSKSTVSKVINDHPTIPAETKARVTEIIKKLNYTPNANAKNLAMQRSGSIALIIDINRLDLFGDIFFTNIILGIEKHALSNDLDLTIFNVNHVESTADFMKTFISGRKSDGMIVPVSLLDDNILGILNRNRFPFVVLGDPRSDARVNWVDFDNRRGAADALAHLFEAGYRKIAYIGGLDESPLSLCRFDGYRLGLEELGLAYRPKHVKKELSSVDAGYRAMTGLLQLKDRPDAVLCEDNQYLFGAYKAIQHNGLSIPGDIGVVTFNDAPFAPYLEPPASAVVMDTFRLGSECAKMLVDIIEEPTRKAVSLTLPPLLTPRESSSKR
jgi:DNA-binding LacI/PurR family transcriptional regulator